MEEIDSRRVEHANDVTTIQELRICLEDEKRGIAGYIFGYYGYFVSTWRFRYAVQSECVINNLQGLVEQIRANNVHETEELKKIIEQLKNEKSELKFQVRCSLCLNCCTLAHWTLMSLDHSSFLQTTLFFVKIESLRKNWSGAQDDNETLTTRLGYSNFFNFSIENKMNVFPTIFWDCPKQVFVRLLTRETIGSCQGVYFIFNAFSLQRARAISWSISRENSEIQERNKDDEKWKKETKRKRK